MYRERGIYDITPYQIIVYCSIVSYLFIYIYIYMYIHINAEATAAVPDGAVPVLVHVHVQTCRGQSIN